MIEAATIVFLIPWLIGVLILSAVCWICAKIADATGPIVGPILLGGGTLVALVLGWRP